jgi:peptide/nickel transport system substrate-binding protein
MCRVEARDTYTLVVHWKPPYLAANLLSHQQFDPLPHHLLAEKYRTNRVSFAYGEDWTSGYIGSGPFRVERWTPGSALIARAHQDWALGPPKLEALDIRFVSDPNTLVANLMAGEVDLINSPGVSGPEAAIASDRWVVRGEGYIKTWQRTLRFLAFQFREVPGWQRAVTDLRVRQALLHAVDRQALAAFMTYDLGSPADAFIVKSAPIFEEVDRAIVKYPYDPARAGALLSDAGWSRRQGGEWATNALGHSLDIEIAITGGSGDEQEAAIVTDYWRAARVNASISVIPAARQRDLEMRVSFPAVSGTARSMTLDNFVFTSANFPTAEAHWQGANRGSFSDPEVDRLHDLAMTSLQERPRREATIALHRHMSGVLGIGLLHQNPKLLVAKHKVRGPLGESPQDSGLT